MARNRMLNPEFWLDEDIAKLSAHARLLYMGLWGICDDNYATFPNRPEWVKAQVFPYDDVNIRELLGELSVIGKITLFTYEGSQYFYIKNFFKHQRVERPSKPKYPEYKPENKVLGEPSVSPRSEVKLSEEKLKEDKGKEIASLTPTPRESAQRFFLMVEEENEELIQFIARMVEKYGNTHEYFSKELKKFTGYWTEKNATGTKQRWQTEKTFEVQRRLATWFSNAPNFSKRNNNPKSITV